MVPELILAEFLSSKKDLYQVHLKLTSGSGEDDA
jgi:hypothetical protein